MLQMFSIHVSILHRLSKVGSGEQRSPDFPLPLLFIHHLIWLLSKRRRSSSNLRFKAKLEPINDLIQPLGTFLMSEIRIWINWFFSPISILHFAPSLLLALSLLNYGFKELFNLYWTGKKLIKVMKCENWRVRLQQYPDFHTAGQKVFLVFF